MALIVQKFGGTSVGTLERIREVARQVLASQNAGNQVVVVVSAMSGETNRLVKLATEINPMPFSREYDLLIASGEQVAAGLLALAINALQPGRARALLGHQIGILTDSVFSKARIRTIDTQLIRGEIASGVIPIIAGFQGVDPDGNITTLGRGGSDTSAVAIAIAVGADDCEIYTDVDGVYSTDPRVCVKARKISKISYEEMMELASLGAKVLQIRSVELAAKYELPLHVKSSFNSVEGTRVVSRQLQGQDLEEVVVAGIASDADQVKLTLHHLIDKPGVAAKIFGALSREAVVVDVIVQDTIQTNNEQGAMSLSFTVTAADRIKAKKVLEALSVQFQEEPGLAKVSIVGVGMQHHPGVAAKMFELLAGEKINIKLITTSEIKVSCLIAGDDLKRAVSALHTGFGLD